MDPDAGLMFSRFWNTRLLHQARRPARDNFKAESGALFIRRSGTYDREKTLWFQNCCWTLLHTDPFSTGLVRRSLVCISEPVVFPLLLMVNIRYVSLRWWTPKPILADLRHHIFPVWNIHPTLCSPTSWTLICVFVPLKPQNVTRVLSSLQEHRSLD